jgi:hypothetical protein
MAQTEMIIKHTTVPEFGVKIPVGVNGFNGNKDDDNNNNNNDNNNNENYKNDSDNNFPSKFRDTPPGFGVEFNHEYLCMPVHKIFSLLCQKMLHSYTHLNDNNTDNINDNKSDNNKNIDAIEKSIRIAILGAGGGAFSSHLRHIYPSLRMKNDDGSDSHSNDDRVNRLIIDAVEPDER